MKKLLIGASLAWLALTASAQELQNNVIWLSSAPTGQQAYVAFRKTFDLPEPPQQAKLHIFADSRYTLWINGRYVLRGPCRFDPKAPEFDSVDAAPYLNKGANAIAVLVHHCHDGKPADFPEGFVGRLMRHAPGLTACLDITDVKGSHTVLCTGPTWRASAKTRYQPSITHWGGIFDNIDARLDTGDWSVAAFDDAQWESASPVPGNLWGPMRPRAIPLLTETPITPASIIRMPGKEAGEPLPFAGACPMTLREGEELLLGLAASTLAYDLIDLEAEAGAAIEVSHGQGCVDGRLDETYGANRYVARNGRQTYMGNDQQGFRYTLIRAVSGTVTLHGVQAVQRYYPFNQLGRFACNDNTLTELWQRGVRTVQLCSEDGYEDCNARERVEWMGDAALSEYPITSVTFAGPSDSGAPVYGDPRLIRNMLRHIAQSQQPDGRLKAHHPSDRWDIHGYIEDYACLWVMTLKRYCDNTGDLDLVRELWPALTAQLQWFLDHRASSGLIKAREFVFFDNPLSYKECEGTTLNAYAVGAFNAAADLGALLGENDAGARYREAAASLKQSLNTHLWDPAEQAYHGGIMNGEKTPCTAFAAMTALYFDIVPESDRAALLGWFVKHAGEVGTPFTHYFVFAALYAADQPDLDTRALQIMRNRWAPTLARKDLDTVFEGFDGGALCHNMGATASYYLSTCVLGVRQQGPVSDRHIRIEPHLGDLTLAEGTVVTPWGPVAVSWKNLADKDELAFQIDVPAGTQADLAIPAPAGREQIWLNASPVDASDITRAGNRAVLTLAPGKYEGHATQ